MLKKLFFLILIIFSKTTISHAMQQKIRNKISESEKISLLDKWVTRISNFMEQINRKIIREEKVIDHEIFLEWIEEIFLVCGNGLKYSLKYLDILSSSGSMSNLKAILDLDQITGKVPKISEANKQLLLDSVELELKFIKLIDQEEEEEEFYFILKEMRKITCKVLRLLNESESTKDNNLIRIWMALIDMNNPVDLPHDVPPETKEKLDDLDSDKSFGYYEPNRLHETSGHQKSLCRFHI